jgi:hypothetical protein
LAALASKLSAAGTARDWPALAAADAALAPALAKLAAQGDWNGQERSALSALRAAHRQARLDCTQAKERLGSKLDEMQANKEGWMAYALYSDTDPDGNQE